MKVKIEKQPRKTFHLLLGKKRREVEGSLKI
jgi:hypothetical protein